jgi:RpiB/LacA/LacB family sugar-phosphate isomerase
MGSVDTSECNIIFVVRRDHVCNFSIDKTLKGKFGEDIAIVVAEEDTRGSVDSCLLAKDLINNEIPLVVYNPDIYFEPKFRPTDETFASDGLVLTFKANSPNYSYVQSDANANVTRTAEKIVISKDAAVGVYCFKSGKLFVEVAEEAKTKNQQTKNEFYVCPLYNNLIARNMSVKMKQVPLMYVMGTPEEMKFFKGVVFPYFLKRTLILCGDHSGFSIKEQAKKFILENDIPFINCGCYSEGDCDYSDYIAQAVETKTYFPGGLILGFCRSGQGVNICANKYPNIRSALVTTESEASLAIRHNAANAFAIPQGQTNLDELKKIIMIAVNEKFEGGRHQNRLQGQRVQS